MRCGNERNSIMFQVFKVLAFIVSLLVILSCSVEPTTTLTPTAVPPTPRVLIISTPTSPPTSTLEQICSLHEVSRSESWDRVSPASGQISYDAAEDRLILELDPGCIGEVKPIEMYVHSEYQQTPHRTLYIRGELDAPEGVFFTNVSSYSPETICFTGVGQKINRERGDDSNILIAQFGNC